MGLNFLANFAGSSLAGSSVVGTATSANSERTLPKSLRREIALSPCYRQEQLSGRQDVLHGQRLKILQTVIVMSVINIDGCTVGIR